MSNEDGNVLPLAARKSPLLAAALNLIPLPFALGYAYLGSWKRFTWSMFLRVGAFGVGSIIYLFSVIPCNPYCSTDQTGFASALWILTVVVVLGFNALGAYREAEQYNAESRKAERDLRFLTTLDEAEDTPDY